MKGLLALLVCWVGFTAASSSDSFGYDVDYYDDYDLYNKGYDSDYLDDYEISDIDDSTEFNPYTGYYDDLYNDYFFDDPEIVEEDCTVATDGAVKFNGTGACDIKLVGADAIAQKLHGGLDGVYKVAACENGRPMYKRDGGPAGEDRVLWYSSQFRDWDIANGTTPQEDDILMYGGSGGRESRPQYVFNQWNVATEFMNNASNIEEYTKVDATVECADGSKTEKKVAGVTASFGAKPLISDDDMLSQYSAVYERAKRNQEPPSLNLGILSLFVMIAMGIVFGMPYFMARRKFKRTKPRQGGILARLGLGAPAHEH
jgi:iron-regulated transporter 1